MEGEGERFKAEGVILKICVICVLFFAGGNTHSSVLYKPLPVRVLHVKAGWARRLKSAVSRKKNT